MEDSAHRPVNIVGGISWNRMVRIISDEYVSTAAWDERDGSILSTIEPRRIARSPRMRRILKCLPKTVRLFMSLWSMGGHVLKVMLALHVFLIVGTPLAFGVIPPKAPYPDIYLLISEACVLYAFAVIAKTRIATWHAAEHKAIRSYLETGRTDIASLAEASRIDPQCGGRFILPFLLVSPLSWTVAYLVGTDTSFVWLALMEVVLWSDALIGLQRIPVISHASFALQRHVTTAEPGGPELTTAQIAIRRLLDVHHGIAWPQESRHA